jgi:cytochrome P450
MHMNERFFEQSTLFNPDRFVKPSNTACSILDMENADVDNQDVFLFGFGPRRCPGLHMVSTNNKRKYKIMRKKDQQSSFV